MKHVELCRFVDCLRSTRHHYRASSDTSCLCTDPRICRSILLISGFAIETKAINKYYPMHRS